MNSKNNKDIDYIINILKDRFIEKNLVDLKISWEDIKNRMNNKNIIESILYMEETNGKPSIISYDSTKDKYIIYDTSIETHNRRSLCYNRKALESRKKA